MRSQGSATNARGSSASYLSRTGLCETRLRRSASTCSPSTRDGDNASVDVTVNGREGFTFTIPLPLIHEDGEWRVCFGRPGE